MCIAALYQSAFSHYTEVSGEKRGLSWLPALDAQGLTSHDGLLLGRVVREDGHHVARDRGARSLPSYKATVFSPGGPTLMTLSHPNPFPTAPPLNTRISLSFYPHNISRWELNLNT